MCASIVFKFLNSFCCDTIGKLVNWFWIYLLIFKILTKTRLIILSSTIGLYSLIPKPQWIHQLPWIQLSPSVFRVNRCRFRASEWVTAWMKEVVRDNHRGGGACLRCPVSTSVHFSLCNEGSSEYMCVKGERGGENIYRVPECLSSRVLLFWVVKGK